MNDLHDTRERKNLDPTSVVAFIST
jgi:hypothetical protein